MAEEQPGELIPLPLNSPDVHPSYRDLSPDDLRGALSAALAFESRRDVLAAVSWVLGARLVAPEVAPLERPLPHPGDVSLEVLQHLRVVPKLKKKVKKSRRNKQLPLVGLVRARKD